MIRLDVVEIREEFVNRTVTEEVSVPTDVTIRVATKDAAGNPIIEERIEQRFVSKPLTRVISEPKTYIEYAAPGRRAYATTVKTLGEIRAIQDAKEGEEDNEDRVVEAQKRDFLLAYYDAHKKGHEMPLSGVPLGAWGAINAKTAELFKVAGIRTVEEVSELGEQAKSRLGHIGNLTDLIKQAKMFLASSDKLAVSNQLKTLEAEKDALSEQVAEQARLMEDMRRMMVEMQQAQGASDRPKRAKAEVAA